MTSPLRAGLLALICSLAPPLASAQTSLTFNSQPGDYVGQGQQLSYAPADGSFLTTVDSGRVSVSFGGFGSTPSWVLEFAAPHDAPLAAGVYDRAEQVSFHNPTRPGLDLSGDGRSCSAVAGRFIVLQAVYAGGGLQSFAADFEQHCEGSVPALFGSVRINSSVPRSTLVSVDSLSVVEGDSGTRNLTFTVSLSRPSAGTVTVDYATANSTAVAGGDYTSAAGMLTFPAGVTALQVPVAVSGDTSPESDESFVLNLSAPSGAAIGFGQGSGAILDDEGLRTSVYVNSQTGDYVGQGGEAGFGVADAGFSVSRLDNRVSIALEAGALTSWGFAFAAPPGMTLGPGVYEGAQRFPLSPAVPGLEVEGEGRGCSTVTGRFVVFEAAYGAGGVVQSFAADFEQHCEGGGPALFGSVRYRYKATSSGLSQVSITNATVDEDTFDPTAAVFAVSLSAPRQSPSQISYAAADGTAMQVNDYAPTSGVLVFERDATLGRISVPIVNDDVPELDETFLVNLTSPVGLTIADGQGLGLIVNDDFAEPTVVTGVATSIGQDSATLNGIVNPNALPTSASFEYGLDAGYGSLSPTTSIGSGVVPVGVAASVAGLTCGALYHFRPIAENDYGPVEGSDQTFTTAICAPPTVVTNAVSGITQTGATLNGTVNPNRGATIRRFEYGLTAGYGGVSPDLAAGSGSSALPVSFVLTGLGCNTLYHYRAVGQNGAGTGIGGDLTFTTAACPPAGSNNISALTAQALALNSASQDSMSNVRAELWFRVRLFAARSYQFSAWPVNHEQGADAPAVDLAIFSDPAGAVAATPAPAISSGAIEGSPNGNGDALPASLLFQPAATGVYRIRVLRSSGGTVTHSVNVAVRETTLFSPWTSRAAGFEGFVEMHNNTNAALSVTLRAYNSAGALQGAGLTFSLPANATVFKTATNVGVPANVFAGMVLTHDGAFGAVSGNITTLNGANGLSFDSPFTPRGVSLQAPPVR